MILRLLFLVEIAILLVFSGCALRTSSTDSDFQAQPSLQSSKAIGNFFCGAKNMSPVEGLSPRGLWTADEVQDQLTNLNRQENLFCKPWSAYAVSYKAMTKQRDEARCTPKGALNTSHALNQDLMDGLADAMTRFFVEITKECLARTPSDALEKSLAADPGNSWCRLYDRSRGLPVSPETCEKTVPGKDDSFCGAKVNHSFGFAMGGTAVYLTSHIALALAALPHLNWVWVSEPSLYATNQDELNRKYKMRVEYLTGRNESLNQKYGKNSFKKDYDGFNAFLVKNLETVSDSLQDQGLIRGKLLGRLSGLFDGGKMGEQVFDVIRDKSYDLASELMLVNPFPGNHPMVTREANKGIQLSERLDLSFKWKDPNSKIDPVLKQFGSYAEKIGIIVSVRLLALAGGMRLQELDKKGCSK
jgi:hypothetical protein